MSPVEELDVYLGETRVAVLREAGGGYAALSYDPDVIARYGNNAILISLGLPLRSETYPGIDTRPFLDGLLPEGDSREAIARALRVDRSDIFGLLRELGRDVAGALVIVRSGEPVDARTASVRWLSAEELDAEIVRLPYAPLGVTREGDVRLSLAGVQPKLALVGDLDGRLGLPIHGSPTTHILKPPSMTKGREGNLLFPDLAENEAYCMRIARHAGLEAASVAIYRSASGEVCLLVERYDRVQHGDGEVTRLHQEDSCQALRVAPENKYEEHGGPSLAQIADLLARYATSPLPDRYALLDAQLLHALVGNTDAHGKNVSFLYTEMGVRLAPLYDVVSTAVYPGHPRDLAMRIGGEIDVDHVKMESIEQAYHDCGLNPELARRRVPGVLSRFVRAAAQAMDDAVAEGWNRPILEDIQARIVRIAEQIEPEIR